jgi:hypothetical protein
MKTLELQLITVGLDDGQQGIFVGLPLLTKQQSCVNKCTNACRPFSSPVSVIFKAYRQ